MSASFAVHSSIADGVAQIDFDGDVDLSTLPAIRDAITPFMSEESCRAIVIDLSMTTFIDSSGLGELITKKKQAQTAAKRFTITGAQGNVARIIELTGLDEYLLGETVID